jgi:uncharacterized membrane protein YphA (DoxX/SURF4 family)
MQNKKLWAGRIISALICLPFLFSASMKLFGTPNEEMLKGMEHLGISPGILTPLGILELTCVLIYAIPQTAVLGSVLLTDYMGGTIITHWRVGDPFVPNIVIGLLIWLGVYLREPRLHAVLPWRK